MNLVQWQAVTGDNSVSEVVSFPDSSRSIETYMVAIGQGETVEAFIEKCRIQDRFNWDKRFTAQAVNNWIKQGFRKQSINPPADFINQWQSQ